MERFFGIKVNLHTWVKVKEDWRNREGLIHNFGLDKRIKGFFCRCGVGFCPWMNLAQMAVARIGYNKNGDPMSMAENSWQQFIQTGRVAII